jgi:dienelactone hydrolase
VLRRRRIAAAALIATAAVLASGAVVPRYLRAAALVVDASGVTGWPHDVAGWHATSFRAEERAIPSRHGPLRARVYRPGAAPRGTLVLVPGIHAGPFEDPRLGDLAGHLASRRYTVVAVGLPDFVRYRIAPRATDMIEDAAAWAARDEGARGVGLLGVSFAGGLAVAAAGRPALRDRLRLVVSLGGHGDLRRTLEYLCTGALADGTRRPPHDYGVAIALLAMADRVAPPAQQDRLREGVLAFLEGSRLAGADEGAAAAAFARARALETGMPEPSASLLRAVNARDVATLGAVLRPHVGAVAGDPALSPELSPPPAAPVYLLHGAGDDVIPAVESRLLAAHLRGHTRVRLLVTPVLRHADVRRRPGLRDGARLVGFWAGALDE